MIRAILFDFGNVLNAPQDPNASDVHRVGVARRLGLEPEMLWTYLFDGEPARRLMRGELPWHDFWTAVLPPRGISDPAEIEAIAENIFTGTEQFHPDMVRLLGELTGRYKLAVVSNTWWSEEEMRQRFAEDYGLDVTLLDAIISSASAGHVKPEPAIFLAALDRLGVAPHEAIFTDDMASFTAAAAALGLHAHTFTTPARFRAYLARIGVAVAQAEDEEMRGERVTEKESLPPTAETPTPERHA
jgi:HAD superfamily hydrolase (TIGR01509 family)